MWLVVALSLFGSMVVASLFAPEFLSQDVKLAYAWPHILPPFGADYLGKPLWEYAMQGAAVVLGPAAMAGIVVALFAAVAGLARCAGLAWFDTLLQAFSELMGALPRMVVVLVVALTVPREFKTLVPVALAWALLAAPGAMDEAASAAGRLGGARFVEALRAHGFSAVRIYMFHITWLNLRMVLARQAVEVMMQVVFLEIALSYLAAASNRPAITHSDAWKSWADLLYLGYTTAAGGELWGAHSMLHSLALGLALVAGVAFMTMAFRRAARLR
ncbi:MAG: ABC-type dipeptide/oligopeptide/nickel transport system permease subunit [Kiritimatiellia bacterium]